MVSLDDPDGDDNGIEVIEEIPCNRSFMNVRKTFYHSATITTVSVCGDVRGVVVVYEYVGGDGGLWWW